MWTPSWEGYTEDTTLYAFFGPIKGLEDIGDYEGEVAFLSPP